tara:strand:- start:10395 stop:10709 length:315 start_codon:yes stop_codon:yes gene_type:complete
LNDNEKKDSEIKFIPVAQCTLVQRGDEFIGMELDYTENVKDARGASYILNVLRNCINEAGWVTSTVLKVRGSDAPNEGTASKESDTDSKVSEEEERASKSVGAI